jgi:hypothetical protein
MNRISVVLLLVLVGCAATTSKATLGTTPKERVTECQNLCREVGLQMSALVVIMSSAGCVCQVVSSSAGAPAAISGGAVIAAAEAARRQARQNTSLASQNASRR